MDNEARILLDDTIAFCQRDGQETRLINMLEQCRALELDGDRLAIEAPSRFAYSYLERQRELLERYLEEIAFMPVTLDISVPSVEGRGGTSAAADGATTATAPTAATAHATETTQHAASPSPAAHSESAASTEPAPQPFPAATVPASPAASAPAATAYVPTTAAPAQPHAPQTHGATTASGISVKNTLSADAFRRMMEEMKSNEVPRSSSPRHRAATASEPSSASTRAGDPITEEYPSVDVNSKFTFENFVFGDENRHAYQSSLRFAAFADEPGQCTSLFIYGNSGLGKTHLLFAIKNYLAAEKPQLQVKYANSGAYINDYMQELELQNMQRQSGRSGKSSSGRIMRDYRDADILIIDDIQNIVGKQASVEFFFQLVDEFIRAGKKIAIASDRAPKNLGLDERLTSRFNAGMLCLVSEPGFEMKYAILKSYYENTIHGAKTVTPDGEMPSLLSGMDLSQGKLTKEQLEHMAEISGNNIRELQGFCERCAGLSYERELAGRELTAEDIDHVADEFFDTAHKVVRPQTILSVVEEFYHVSHEDIISKKRSKNIVFPRHVAAYLTNTMCEMSLKAVGAIFGRDHTTVIHSIEVIEKKEADDARFREELQQIKNVILLKS